MIHACLGCYESTVVTHNAYELDVSTAGFALMLVVAQQHHIQHAQQLCQVVLPLVTTLDCNAYTCCQCSYRL